MCTRRLTYVPEAFAKNILHLPEVPSTRRGIFGAFSSWWRRMSDPELKELRARDLLTDSELGSLSFRPEEAEADEAIDPLASAAREAAKGQVPKLFQVLGGALTLRSTLPANAEAKRRIVSFARSVTMRPLPEAKVQEMPTVSVVIPHYGETILYSKDDLFSQQGDGGSVRW
eukprot:Skav228809  [mRNA]  locus=scaffold359:226388:233403:+ [translate_table: standard]